MDLLRRRFLALADSSRLLALLLLEAEGELCLCQLQEVLELAPSTVSRHMQLLKDTGFVASRKDGRWVHFRLESDLDSRWLELVHTSKTARKLLKEKRHALKTSTCITGAS
jgi:DNA-binding transcriptional ArsR family regulator